MLIEKREIGNFVDGNVIYNLDEDFSSLLENLKHDMKILCLE